jgi:hypothetical protein
VNIRQLAVNIRPERSSPPAYLTTALPPMPPPLAGVGGRYSDAAWRSTLLASRHLASPIPEVVGEPAEQAGCQLSSPTSPPSTMPGPMWASMVRGAPRGGDPTCPRPLPAVCAADFMALYDRCLAGGIKARLVISQTAGVQTLTITCSIPAPA